MCSSDLKPDATFILGGGSRAWVWAGGGAATCKSELYLYPSSVDHPAVYLATTGTWAARA